MKFSHSLQFNAVPEWSSQYLTYSSLKKLIYALQKQTLIEKAQDEESSLLDPTDPIQIFTQALDKDLEKIDKFYQRKEAEFFEDLQTLADEVEEFQNEVKLRNDVMFNSEVFVDNDEQQESATVESRKKQKLALDEALSARPSFSRLSSDLRERSDLLSHQAPEIYGDGNDDSEEDDDDDDDNTNLLKKKKSNHSKLDRTLSNPLKYSLINSLQLKDSFLILSDIKIALKKRIIQLYTSLSELKSFIELNHTGFKKILKKFDKTLIVKLKNHYMDNTLIEQSYIFKPHTLEILKEKIDSTIKLYATVSTNGSMTVAENELSMHLREHVVWERNTVWRDMINIERKSQAANIFNTTKPDSVEKSDDHAATSPLTSVYSVKIVVILLTSILLLFVSPFDEPEQRHCFSLLIGASMFWATEAVPLFVTSLAMPLFVILLKVLKYDDKSHTNYGEAMTATDASKYILGTMWSSVIMLLLGGFTLAAALSKYSITRILSTMILSKSGTNPSAILLTIMLISLLVSAVVSNVAAPVLCYSIIQPLLRTLPTHSNFARSLILGIAFASNLGGVSSPISSPQNIIAIELMDPQPSWIQWFLISAPVCLISLVLIWMFLLVSFKVNGNGNATGSDNGEEDSEVIQIAPIQASTEKFTPVQWFIIAVSIVTIILWCFANQLSSVFGEIGVISLIPIVLFFGSGILTSEDWNNFLWTIVALAMGGIALGKAVSSSGLLNTIAIVIQERLITGLEVYQVCLIFGILCLVISTFISHTVSALILLPLVKEIGQTMKFELEDGTTGDYSRLLVMLNVILCSIAMGLPTSGFPNVTAICMTDQVGRNYVDVKTFITRGVPASAVSYVVAVTVGYLIMSVMKF